MTGTTVEGKPSQRIVGESFVMGALFGCFISFLISMGWALFEERWARWSIDRENREDALIEFAYKYTPAGEHEDLLLTPLHGYTPRWAEVGKIRWELRNAGRNMPEPFEQTLGVCKVEGLSARCPVYDLYWVRRRLDRPPNLEAAVQ